ncbi:MAG: ABC transporter ATP-binding protein [Microbacteriaceae bacterium]
MLEVSHLTKRYGGLVAVDDVSFAVEEGEILGIAGPNGAGKTTLFDAVTGMVPATSGLVRFRGNEIQGKSVTDICHRGLTRTFQHPSVFDTQTVLANAMIGSVFGSGVSWWRSMRKDPSAVDRARNALEVVGLTERATLPAGDLPVFDKKRLMIASALASEPVMIFLDEPFGGLTSGEIDELMALVRGLQHRGITIVLIEHVMRALSALSDRVVLLDQGSVLFEGHPDEMVKDPEVIRVYLGEGPQDVAHRNTHDEVHDE